MRHCIVLLAGALVPAAALDFDQGVRSRPALEDARTGSRSGAGPSGAPAEDWVWLTFSRADVETPGTGLLPLGAPVLEDRGELVFRVRAERLPELSRYMHERHGRCGGFFASRTPEEARESLLPKAKQSAAAYTLDQQSFAAPAVARAGETGIKEVIEGLSSFTNRYYSADSGEAASRWLLSRWQAIAARIPGATAELAAHTGWRQPSVVLTIPGAEKPEEHVILGGHLDSINGWQGGRARAPGADDNASGIAVLTEAARALADSGFRPRRTVSFMAFAAEEVGLRGSQDLAQRYQQGGRRVIGMMQFDMTNHGSEDKVYFLSDDGHTDPALSAFLGKVADAYAGVPWGTTSCGYACSDHASWSRAGFPAAAAFEARFGDHNRGIHSERDTLAAMGGSARHSVPFARVAAGFAIELAKHESRPAVAAR